MLELPVKTMLPWVLGFSASALRKAASSAAYLVGVEGALGVLAAF
jgi:hypothetical protein